MLGFRHSIVYVALLAAACGTRTVESGVDVQQPLASGDPGLTEARRYEAAERQREAAGERADRSKRARSRALLEAVHPLGVEADWDRPGGAPARVRLRDGWMPRRSRAAPAATALEFLEAAGAAWGVRSVREELRVSGLVPDGYGRTVVRLTQSYHGIPVNGPELQVVVGRDGTVETVLGIFEAGITIDPRPAVGQVEAVAALRRSLRNDESIGQARLVVLPAGEERAAPLLAWEVGVNSPSPLRDRRVWLAATDGAALLEVPRAIGLYREVWKPTLLDDLPPVVDLSGPSIQLGTLLMDEAGAVDGYTPEDDAFAAYNSVRMYDEFLTTHQIHGYTNAYDVYRSVISSEWALLKEGGAYFSPNSDVSTRFAAFATGGKMFLDGNPSFGFAEGPNLAVVSHEWTHGLLLYTGKLETGFAGSAALHEALADSIACMVDSDRWAMPAGNHLRHLDNPTLSAGYLAHYASYASDSDKYHRSTIFSHAVYLFANTNPSGNYNVQATTLRPVLGIGRAKAAQILLHAIRYHLFEGADFKAARWGAITACEELSADAKTGVTSVDCGSVADAFAAVGIPRYDEATVRARALTAKSMSDCIDQGGTGFPPNADIRLVFEDGTTGVQTRDQVVRTDSAGNFFWWFGLACTDSGFSEAETAKARDRANALLNRIDLGRVAFTGRPFRYWAEYSDAGPQQSNVVSYTLDYAGECVPVCDGRVCGDNRCGGVCGDCAGSATCSAGGACIAAGAPATTACGSIGTAHWTAANSPVLVTCDTMVTKNSILTIDAGVEVMFQSASTDLIVADGATLLAKGTLEKPILFTSGGEAAPSSWGGINVQSGSLRVNISHAEFRHGGATSSAAGYPILLNPAVPHTIDHVRLVQNRINAIGLSWPYGGYTSNVQLSATGVPYWVHDDLVVGAGATMTVDPGVVVKLEKYVSGGYTYASDIIVNGRLVANGTATQPIFFTSSRDDVVLGDANADGPSTGAPSDWGGIYIAGDKTQATSEISNAVIRFGGEPGSSQGFPLRVFPTTQPLVSAVSFVSNRIDAIGLAMPYGGFSADLRLNVVGLPYWIQDDVTVNAGYTMTVDPGVVVKMQKYVSSGYTYAADIIVNGRLVANGTMAQPITFTSYRDDAVLGDTNADGPSTGAPSDWGGIYLAGDKNQVASELSNVVIRYAGETNGGQGYPLKVYPVTQPLVSAVSLTSNRLNAIGLTWPHGGFSENFRLNVVGLPYWLRDEYTNDLTVNAGATMTVDPGVVVKLEKFVSSGYTYAADIVVKGRLVANGTAAQPITFTSYRDDSVLGDTNADGPSAGVPSDWGGIYLAGDKNQVASDLSNVVIRYAGETAGGQGYPLKVHPVTQPLVSAVTLASNRLNAIGLTWPYGGFSENFRLNVVGLPYWLRDEYSNDLTVNAGATMTVDPGVVVKLEKFAGLSAYAADIIVKGRLVANGTPTQPITFTSYRDDSVLGDTNADGATAPAAADWGGIRFEAGSTGSVSYATLAYGGDSSGADCAVRVTGSAPSLHHVTFRSNEDGVCIHSGGQPDLGGGASGSPGQNRFEGHVAGSGNWAISNVSALDVSARNNWWGVTTAADVDAIIYDRLDNATYGRVLHGAGRPSPANHDFDGDGRADILWRNSGGDNYLWLMNGTTRAGGGWLSSVPAPWSIAGTGDFDGDGKADILWRSADGSNYLWLMNGASQAGGGWLGAVPTAWTVAGVGDFDGDGKADIFWRKADGSNYLWLMNSTSQAGGGGLVSVPTAWSVAGVGDFNGDAKADILWRNVDGSNYLWLMNGTTQVGGGWLGSVPAAWSVAGVADLDGDGKTDILWRNTTGDNYVWLMNGTTQAGGGGLARVPTTWSVATLADFDGDGKADIQWRSGDGSNYLWTMNGATQAGGGWLPSAGTDWQVAGSPGTKPAGPSAANSHVSVDVASLPADGSTPATVTVTANDAANRPLVGLTVALSYSGNANISPASIATDALGKAFFLIRAPAATMGMLTATAGTGAGQIVVLEQPWVIFFTPPRPGTYVAMGDSFQSGVGASYNSDFDLEDYYPETRKWSVNQCLRSPHAYASSVAQSSQAPSSLKFVACSGAVIDNLTDVGLWDESAQLGHLTADTRLVTVGVGGNDLGFSSVLEDCVAWAKDCSAAHGVAVDQKLHDLMTPLENGRNRFEDLFWRIRERAPNSRILALGYPRLFVDGGSGSCLLDTLLFRQNDQTWANNVIGMLNAVIRQAAASVSADGNGLVEYVDLYAASAGKEICANSPTPFFHDLRGDWHLYVASSGDLVSSNDQSFHPTAEGHRLIAEILQRVLVTPPGN